MKTTETISTAVALAAIAAGAYLLSRKSKQPTNMSTNKSLPRGYRNNNPLNIRYNTANNWVGKVLPNTDGAFEQFKDMSYGYRAALYLIRKYIGQGNNTVSSVISKWAPATENNTSGYITRVCNTTGYLPGTVLSASDKEQLCKLVYAMAIVENGNTPLPDMSEIYEGWSLL